MSYQHVGQHGAASSELVRELRPATPAEYADLLAELKDIGYCLRVKKETGRSKRSHSTIGFDPSQLRVGQQFDYFGHTYEILKIGRDKNRTVQIARPHTDRFGKVGFIDHRSFPARDFDRQHLRPLAV